MGVPKGAFLGIELCRRYQFAPNTIQQAPHHFGTCKYRKGHACYFCAHNGWGGWGHGGFACTRGGAAAIEAFVVQHDLGME